MGLNNSYVGETETTSGKAKLYSRLWIHQFANRSGLAYTDDEAVELGRALKAHCGERLLTDEEIEELIESGGIDLSGALGRNLEEDEEEHLEENPRDVVIDC